MRVTVPGNRKHLEAKCRCCSAVIEFQPGEPGVTFFSNQFGTKCYVFCCPCCGYKNNVDIKYVKQSRLAESTE